MFVLILCQLKTIDLFKTETYTKRKQINKKEVTLDARG